MKGYKKDLTFANLNEEQRIFILIFFAFNLIMRIANHKFF